MAISYLHDPNHLLVHIVPSSLAGGDELLTYIALRAKYDMTGLDLKEAGLSLWNLNEDNHRYKLVTWLGGQDVDVDEKKTLKEMGIRNGAPIQIIAV
ncbi:hypothetical protein M670_03296 [Schinkia azotoformans MEV2011]|uniref:Ubiquitin-like domain-containing protein n=2 Tax=Schinkia azotoformans TaxID=1454 RepID=K6BXB1_SCHAZ|nr:hypothetical protein [Schinkia azotoformans]EKN63545.1 hypothetical protein BAZO_17784 [Schinkia azotoformans LMG 9581]KEF37488.1 hypothetical protein M670_03296 [Schinkia azotoformans MEV2011]MEC1638845.1 hypothetical protein [Schinkia azotoformans]MEC1697813.1 hypothetical protein [Schinkia azotoformans]MEC1715968.1 hypothetical protein [Schinkia azotoformans]